MKFNTEGKAIFITGCSSGIGYTTALHLARSGFTVFASVRKAEDAEKLNALKESNLIPVCPLDLSHIDDISQVTETVQAELTRRGQNGLYAIINNAGSGGVAPVELMDLERFSLDVRARLVGSIGLVQTLLPLLRQGNGRILWIMTPAAIPTPYVSSIHACDFAVNCIVRTLNIELKPWHIPCVQIRCGGIKTAKGLQTTAEEEAILNHPRAGLYQERLAKWSQDMAAFDEKRTEPEKVAQVVFKALCAPRPRRHYSIGHMAGAAAFLESLPQGITDAILSARF
jgi:NAD(P)-dependent dehydrogenase (short-subunit alcohol dehydrogenase family)